MGARHAGRAVLPVHEHLSLSAFIVFIPVLVASKDGFSATVVGVIIAIEVLTMAMYLGYFGKMADRYKGSHMIVIGTIMVSVGALALGGGNGGLQYRDEHRDRDPAAHLRGYGDLLGDRFHLYFRRGISLLTLLPFWGLVLRSRRLVLSAGNRRNKNHPENRERQVNEPVTGNLIESTKLSPHLPESSTPVVSQSQYGTTHSFLSLLSFEKYPATGEIYIIREWNVTIE